MNCKILLHQQLQRRRERSQRRWSVRPQNRSRKREGELWKCDSTKWTNHGHWGPHRCDSSYISGEVHIKLRRSLQRRISNVTLEGTAYGMLEMDSER